MTALVTTSRLLTQRVSRNTLVARVLSTECEPARRVRDAIMEYKNHNFTREIPTRFRKELLSPYAGSNGSVQVEQLNKLLVNIGHGEVCLTTQEQNELLKATGCSGREITLNKMMELIG